MNKNRLKIALLSLAVIFGVITGSLALSAGSTAYADTTTDTTTTDTQNQDDNSGDNCPLAASADLRWLACPLIRIGVSATNGLQSLIKAFLYTPVEQIFGNDGFKAIGVTFRNIGIGLIVIAGLVMIISQASGMDFVDAYTVRKLLPRMAVALIGITLAWPLMQWVVTFFNDLGLWSSYLISAATHTPSLADKGTFDAGAGILANITTAGTIAAGATVGGAFLISTLGFGGIISLLGTILLALLIGFLVLGIRQVVILVCVIMAPLAIAAYVLPGTQKFWEFWKNTFLTALYMFPIITLFLASGSALSSILSQEKDSPTMTFMALIVFYAPFFLLPFAFKLAGGLMATIFSIANDRSRGGFDRLKNYRRETSARRREEIISGRRNAPRMVTGTLRRAHLADRGGLSLTRAGRNRYQESVAKLRQDTSRKMLEEDAFYSSANDDATGLAMQSGMTRSKFIDQYSKKLMANNPNLSRSAAETEASTALGGLEAGMGATIGTQSMQLAAFRAYAGSNTTWKKEDGSTDWEAINRDSADLMRSGLANGADIAQIIKSNKERADRSAVSYGDLIPHLESIRTNGSIGKRLTQEELEDSAYKGARPADAMFGHGNSTIALLKPQQRQLFKAIQEDNPDQTVRMLALLKGQYDMASSSSPEKADIIAKALQQEVDISSLPKDMLPQLREAIDAAQREYNQSGQQGPVSKISVRKLMEGVSDTEAFSNYHREYSNILRNSMAEAQTAESIARQEAEMRRQAEERGSGPSSGFPT